MARIMVVAGGAWQCPIVRLAKSKGHFVVCTNLYPDSPAFAYADVGVVANVLDREKNLAIARQYRPDAVLTAQSDIAVPTVAYVAEQMGLKGIGLEMANRFTNKYTMREFTSRSGFPSPRFRKCYTEEQAVDFLRQTPVAILKPAGQPVQPRRPHRPKRAGGPAAFRGLRAVFQRRAGGPDRRIYRGDRVHRRRHQDADRVCRHRHLGKIALRPQPQHRQAAFVYPGTTTATTTTSCARSTRPWWRRWACRSA